MCRQTVVNTLPVQAGKIVQRHSLLSLLWLEGDGLLAAIGLSQQDLDLLLGLLQLLLTGPHQINALLKLLEGLFQRQRALFQLMNYGFQLFQSGIKTQAVDFLLAMSILGD